MAKEAQRTGRDILLIFLDDSTADSGSAFRQRVLQDDVFKREVDSSFVWFAISTSGEIVDGSFRPSRRPTNGLGRKEISEQQRLEFCAKLGSWLGVGQRPSIVLCDSRGRPDSLYSGYQSETAITVLHDLSRRVRQRMDRDRWFQKAVGSHGANRAKQLDQALRLVEPKWLVRFYRAEIVELLMADPINETGLRVSYELKLLQADVNDDNLRETISKVENLEHEFRPTDEPLQELYYTHASLLYGLDLQASKTKFLEALEVAPNSPVGKRIKSILKRAFPQTEVTE